MGSPPLRCYPVVGMVAYADDAGDALAAWRNLHDVPQKDLAAEMGVSPSVVSDYENGRRENPGVRFVAEYVEAVTHLADGHEPPELDEEVTPSEGEEWETLPGNMPEDIKESVRSVWEGFGDS